MQPERACGQIERWISIGATLGSLALGVPAVAVAGDASECDQGAYTEVFRLEDCTFLDSGRTPYFILVPGFWLRLEGGDRGEIEEVTITVLRDTQQVDGVRTRVIEERETSDGELVEVSRNFFAICAQTGSVVYFGEEVDIYQDGAVVSRDGEWKAGEDGARAGIIMPGTFLLGSRYYQEIAPGIAQDRACNTEIGTTEITPAGEFPECVAVRETSPLEPGKKSFKGYCPGIGLVRDNMLRLADWSERP